MYIGCHLSSVNGFEHMGREAMSIGANTFAFFTRNPRGGKAKAIDAADAAALRELLKENDFGPLVAHAPYTLNPCSDKARVREFALLCMKEDMERMEYLPGNYYNFHPGSHVGQGTEAGIGMIVDILNEIITPDQSTIVLLETMAGKGSEVGGRFEELAAIIDGVRCKDRIGVCMDSCHVSDAGYDIIGGLKGESACGNDGGAEGGSACGNDGGLDGVLEEFDRIVGLSRLRALHINDSKNPPGSHKDRHACIGEGTLGTEVLGAFINHPKLKGLPCILETPNDLDGYAREIALLRATE